jgi:uncharacterized protein (TIGR02246 family)
MGEREDFDGEIRTLYRRVLDGWINGSGSEFAAPFADDGEVIGFDGSQIKGRAAIAEEMDRIFADHPTGSYVGKIRDVRSLGPGAAFLRAIAGVVPAGQSDLDPNLNAVQTLVAEQEDGTWRVVLYQNTPAQFHGRPEAVEAMSEELRQDLQKSG